MTVSYLHDTLQELTSNTIALCKGAKNIVVILMDEPGEHQIHISRDVPQLYIQVRWFDDWASWNIGTTKHNTVAIFQTTVKRYRNQVLNVLNELYTCLGTEKYREAWINHDFPMRQYERLAAANNFIWH